MLEIREKQRWLFDNLNGKCKTYSHYNSKVIFEITRAYTYNNKRVIIGKVIQNFSDTHFVLYPEWSFLEKELECQCYQYLEGQDKA